MTAGGRVTLFDGRYRCLDKPFKQVLDILQQLVILDRHGRLAGHRADQRIVFAGKRNHRVAFQVGERGLHLGVAFAVDQLYNADHFVVVVLHRNHHHRLGVVVVRLVVFRVVRITRVDRQVVHVVDEQRLGGQRHITGDGFFVDRQQELVGVKLHRRFLETDVCRFIAFAVFFRKVERAAIGGSKFNCRIQYQLNQAVKIPFGRERLAHCGQPAYFNVAVCQFFLQLQAVILGMQRVDLRLARAAHLRHWHRGGQVQVNLVFP